MCMLCNHRTISIRLFNNLSDIQTPIQQQLNALIFLLLQVITHPNNNTLTNTNTTHTTPSQTTTHITTTTPTLSTLSPHTTNTNRRLMHAAGKMENSSFYDCQFSGPVRSSFLFRIQNKDQKINVLRLCMQG